MTDRPAYATGNGFVIHKSGARFGLSECEAVKSYLQREIAAPGWSVMLTEGRRRDLADLERAMSESFPQPQHKDVA